MKWNIESTKVYSVFLFIALNFSFLHFVKAQDRLIIKSQGVSISKDKTPKQALEEALEDAKKNALLRAGLPENLFVSNLLHEYGDQREVSRYFHAFSNSELSANILVDSVYQENRTFDQYGNMVVRVEIGAQVYRYDEPKDPGLNLFIEGLKDVYYENEHISFSVTPSQNGYLTIFAFNESEAFVLYPFVNEEYNYLSDQKSRLFLKGEMEKFPVIKAYDPGYSIEMDHPLEDETVLLLFVYTKEDIPWIQNEVTLSSVRSWVYKIPMHGRELVYRNILLKQID